LLFSLFFFVVFTATGTGTSLVERGGFPIKFNADGSPSIVSEPREVRVFDGRRYVMERGIKGDFALIKAWKADKSGNLVFRYTSRNFNPLCAQAGKICIAEVEEIVEDGELHPDHIHLPGIYVQRIVKGEKFEKRIERVTTRAADGHTAAAAASGKQKTASAQDMRERIARRAAREFRDGMYCNLGIGIPTLASNFVPKGMTIHLQTENGMLGMGPYPLAGQQDADLINAGKETITTLPGSATFDSAQSFAMIRGRHVQLTILGAMEVAQNGDLANWVVPGSMVKGPGGAMDLVSSGNRVVVVMEHRTKKGASKLLGSCTLPLTAERCVNRIVTELCVIDIEGGRFVLREVAKGVTVDEVRASTAGQLEVPKDVILDSF
jgi:3-oxoacid CoA-transferase